MLSGLIILHSQAKGSFSQDTSRSSEKVYGCGSPIPAAVEGLTVLDLGCGSGTDVYLASRLVGEKERVIGIDMTEN